MPVPDAITIKRLPVTKLLALHRLFASAVHTSFTYFDDAVQSRTIRAHSPAHLLLATLHPRRVILTAWKDGELLGYAIGSAPASGAGQLFWLYVVPSSRGLNAGLALLSRFLRRERALGATSVNLATYDHRRYYERQGFKYIETRLIDGVKMDIMRYPLA